ncbi:hypothetical protein [Citrobacter arsenatis]|uniref:hypothetical protein n=1 Tax=Citrobacter arsenatis TaxID=2546350 RepID=UPI00300DC2C4
MQRPGPLGTVVCTRNPIPLTINTTDAIDFGQVATGATTVAAVTREFDVQITSGTTTPVGTIKLISDATKANGRINLGGGEVSIWNVDSTVEYTMGQAIPITARDTRLVARLNATGATPGPAEAHLTVTMTVN